MDAAGQDSGQDASTTDAGSTDASSDGSAEASTGGPYGLVYSGKLNGIDSRVATATLSGDGKMLGYSAFANEAPFVITAKIEDVFADSFVSIGKWTDGTVGGSFYDDAGVKTLAANEAQHYGLARVATTLPASGTATYTLLAATKPQIQNGTQAAGTVSSGSFTAVFGGDKSLVGFELVLAMPDGTFNVVANGGATPGDAGSTFTPNDAGITFLFPPLGATNDAGVCSGNCTSGGARVVFSGANAERAVVAYVVSSGITNEGRRGVAVFEKQ